MAAEVLGRAGRPDSAPNLGAEDEEIHFRAMGTWAHVVVRGGPPGLAATAVALVADRERRWSRFLDESLLSELNRRAGAPVRVDDETLELIALAAEGWETTGGRFDPTVHDAVVAAGYDRTFEALPVTVRAADPVTAPGCSRILIDPLANLVCLPHGTALDLGGLAKGYTADAVTNGLLVAGAEGVMVNLGGDLRVGGEAPDPAGWGIAIADPVHPDTALAHVGLVGGGLATSSVARRRWRTADGDAHHLIDPTSGRPVRSGLVAVTVISARAVHAEVLAKAALVAGLDAGRELFADRPDVALFVAADGTVVRTAGFEAFE